jgi:catechol 2,3-dioxygenase-like lactoylglutathione lyase family enzyme
MTKYTFEHIHLLSEDPEATAAFYQKMFDAEIIRSKMPDGGPRIDIKLGGMDVFILPVKSGDAAVGGAPAHPHRGLDHIGLRLSDLDKAMAELKSKGANFTRGPITVRPDLRVAFMTGPDNVSIEILDRDAK